MSAPVPEPGRRGCIVAIGGAEDRLGARTILRRVVDRAGGAEARIAIIPTASRLPDSGERYASVFRDLGAGSATVLPFAGREDCHDPSLLEPLREATGIFLTGGNQLRLSSILGGTGVARLLRQRNAEGAVVAGTSAGAAFLSEHMIAYGREGATPRAGMVALVPGLGLVNQVVIDQHFRERDRLGRLLTALAYNPFAIGLGLDEDTAAFVEPGGAIHVIGRGAITVVDTSALSFSAMGYVREGEPVSLIGLQLHILVHGGSFDLPARTAFAGPDAAHARDPWELEAVDSDVAGRTGPKGRDRGVGDKAEAAANLSTKDEVET